MFVRPGSIEGARLVHAATMARVPLAVLVRRCATAALLAVRTNARPAKSHALALKLVVREEITELFGLNAELFDFVKANFLVFNKAVGDLSARVIAVDEKAQVLIVTLRNGFIFPLFGLLINRDNFFAKCGLLKRLVSSLHCIEVFLVLALAQL